MPAKNIQAHDGSGFRAPVAEPPASPPTSARESKSGERLLTPEETA